MESENRDIIDFAFNATRLPSDSETIKFLKESELPLVLWGAANFAKFIYRILDRNNIPIAAIFTDNPGKNESFNGITVSSFEEVSTKFKKFNILVAHGEQELADKYRKHNKVENIYTIFDFPSYGFSYDEEFLRINAREINDLWNSLSDSLSKESLKAYIASRSSNNWEYIRSFVRHNQYFPEFIHLTNKENVVDCGAYTGDTLSEFIRLTGAHYDRYYALEPSPINAELLRKIVLQKKLNDVYIISKGAWDKQGYFAFIEDTDTSHMDFIQNSEQGNIIETDCIDNMCKANISFIKMDIEGAELMALKGAVKTIQKNKPKLAIAVYHKTEDLITIPKYIKQICPEYKLYFRLHSKLGTDAVIYAI